MDSRVRGNDGGGGGNDGGHGMPCPYGASSGVLCSCTYPSQPAAAGGWIPACAGMTGRGEVFTWMDRIDRMDSRFCGNDGGGCVSYPPASRLCIVDADLGDAGRAAAVHGAEGQAVLHPLAGGQGGTDLLVVGEPVRAVVRADPLSLF